MDLYWGGTFSRCLSSVCVHMQICFIFETLPVGRSLLTEYAVTSHFRVVKFCEIPELPDFCFIVGQTNLGNTLFFLS